MRAPKCRVKQLNCHQPTQPTGVAYAMVEASSNVKTEDSNPQARFQAVAGGTQVFSPPPTVFPPIQIITLQSFISIRRQRGSAMRAVVELLRSCVFSGVRQSTPSRGQPPPPRNLRLEQPLLIRYAQLPKLVHQYCSLQQTTQFSRS